MRALIVKTSALGDIVQTYPVVEYLKSRQNVSHIGWVVEKKFASLVRAHPLVDEVIEIDSKFFRSFSVNIIREFFAQRQKVRSHSWDILFDLQGNCKSGLYAFFARAPIKVGFGRDTVAEWPNILVTNRRKNPPTELSVRQAYLWLVREYFQETESFTPTHCALLLQPAEEQMLANELARWPTQKNVLMLAVGSNWPNKMCSTDSFKKLLFLLKEKYDSYFVFVAGSERELKEVGKLAEGFCERSHVLYRPELPVLQHLMDRAGAVISVDSLLLHLAATTKTPTFGFFGPSLGRKYAPSGQKSGYFQGVCPFHIQFEKRCPYLRTCEEGSCLKKADPAQMFEAVDAWLSKK